MSQAQTDGHAEKGAAALRQRAEGVWGLRAMHPEQPASPEQTQHLVHELQVHQIELELQNEELLRVQGDLEVSRDEYFELYDVAPVGYLTLDNQGLIRRANLTLAALLGTERASLVGLPLTRFTVPEDQDIFHFQRRRLADTGVRQACELRMLRHNGDPFWASIDIVIKPDAGGGPPSYWATVTDISARKQAEALVASEAWRRLLFENSSSGIMLIDPQTRKILAANPEACRLFGRTEAELCSLDRWAILDTTNPYLALASVTDSHIGKFRAEQTYRHADGTLFPVEVTSSTFVGPDGRTGVGIFFLDISERRVREAVMYQSEARYRQLFDNMQEGFALYEVVTDKTGKAVDLRFLETNKAYVRNAGWEGLNFIGKTVREVVPHTDSHRVKTYGKVALTGQPAVFEYFSQTFGRYMRVRAFCPKHGRCATIFEDITDRRQAEEALRIQHDISQALSAADDIHQALELILDAALHMESIDSGGIYLADASGALDLVVHRGLSPAFVDSASHFAAGSAHANLARDGQPRYGLFQDMRPETNAVDDQEGLHTIAVLPVMDQGQMLAVINLSSHTHDVIPAHIRNILEMLALNFGSALRRLRADAAVRMGRQNLRTLFNTLDDFVFVLDSTGHILQFNPVVRNRLGFTAEELAGQDVLTLHPADRRVEAAAILGEMLAGQRNFCRIPLQAKDGTLIPVETHILPGTWDSQPALFGVARDITERTLMEVALAKSQALLNETNRIAQIGGWEIELATGNLAWTEEVFRIHEVEMLYQPEVSKAIDFYAPASRPIIERAVQRAIAVGEPFDVELEFITAKGRRRWVHSIGRADEARTRIFGTIHDITERKRAEEALRESEEKWRGIFEFLPVGVSIVNSNHHVTDTNSALTQILDLSADALLKGGYARRRYFRYDHSLMPPEEFPSIRAAKEQKLIRNVEIGVEKEDGTIIWTSVSATPLSSGTSIATVTVDITERKRAEEVLRESEQRYRLLADNASDVILTMDAHGAFTYISPSEPRLSGYTPEEAMRQTLDEMLMPSSAQEAKLALARILVQAASDHAPESERLELEQRCKDGSTIWTEVIASPLNNESGEPVGIMGVARDISQRRAMEQEIRHLNATLEQQVQERTAELAAAVADLQRAALLKDEFLGAVSHELRTPLVGVLGMAEALEAQFSGPLNDRQARYVQGIHQSGERLLSMVNSLLRYTGLMAGKVVFQPEPCRLSELCAMAVKSVRDRAEQKGQTIETSVDPAGIEIISDADGILEVTEALLDNAIKFTPEGGRMGVEARWDGHAERVRLVVWDTGIGISAEQQAIIFQPFVQGDGGLTRRYGGVGLGLAYVQRMVDLLGGDIALESTPGTGSRFIVTLPIRNVTG